MNKSRGEAARFNAVFEEYSKARDVTRQRIYLETMRSILPQVERKIIVDNELGGILPLLNLDNLGQTGGK